MTEEGFRGDEPKSLAQREAFVRQHTIDFGFAYLEGRDVREFGADAVVLAFDRRDGWSAWRAARLEEVTAPVMAINMLGGENIAYFAVQGDPETVEALADDYRLVHGMRERLLSPPPDTFRVLAFAAGGLTVTHLERPRTADA